MFKVTALERFSCPRCEDFGTVKVAVEPVSGLVSEAHTLRTEWRVCECRLNETLAAKSVRRPTP